MNVIFLDEWLDNALYNLGQIRKAQLVSVDQIRLLSAIEQIKSSLEELRKGEDRDDTGDNNVTER